MIQRKTRYWLVLWNMMFNDFVPFSWEESSSQLTIFFRWVETINQKMYEHVGNQGMKHMTNQQIAKENIWPSRSDVSLPSYKIVDLSIVM